MEENKIASLFLSEQKIKQTFLFWPIQSDEQQNDMIKSWDVD